MPRELKLPFVNAPKWVRTSPTSPLQASRLAGRASSSKPVCGPRNPVLQALGDFAKLVSRKLRAAIPALARCIPLGQPAADETRAQLSPILHALASPHVTAGELRTFIRSLSGSYTQWAVAADSAARSPEEAREIVDAKFREAVKEELDENWPAHHVVDLARALLAGRMHECQSALQSDDGADEQMLIRLASAVREVVLDRAFATIDRDLRAALAPARQQTSASRLEAAFGNASRIIGQLRSCRALPPPACASAEELPDEAARRQKTELLQSRLDSIGASRAGVAGLLKHFSTKTLETFYSNWCEEKTLGASVQRELQSRAAGRPASP